MYVAFIEADGMRERFANVETGVYWDVEDFPVSDIVSFKENVRLALGNEGYHGKVSITAYGADEQLSHQYNAAGITFVSRGSERARIHRMLLDIHMWVADNARSNVMAITKSMTPSEDDEDALLAYYLDILEWECDNVLLAVPDDDYQPENIPRRLNYSVWFWSDLCAGRKPLDDPSRLAIQRPPQASPCALCGK